jgi:hypothetical protein
MLFKSFGAVNGVEDVGVAARPPGIDQLAIGIPGPDIGHRGLITVQQLGALPSCRLMATHTTGF